MIDLVTPQGRASVPLSWAPPRTVRRCCCRRSLISVTENPPSGVDLFAHRRASRGSSPTCIAPSRANYFFDIRRAADASRSGRGPLVIEKANVSSSTNATSLFSWTRSHDSHARITRSCRRRARSCPGGIDSNALQRPKTFLRRRTQYRGRRQLDDHRHGIDRYRLANGRC